MRTRFHYMSLARVLAAIGVIVLHTAEFYVIVSDAQYWIEANILVALAESAVPIFFMLSGATLLDYRERYSTTEFFKKRFLKMFIPLGVWFLISMVYGRWAGTAAMSMPYWFFFVMTGMYLCIPVFSAINKEIREQVFLYVIIISFIFNYLIPFLANVFHFTITYVIPFDVGLGYITYILMGYLLHKKDITSKWKIVIYLFAILGFVLKVVGTYVLSLEIGTLDGTFGHYTNVPCFLLSIGVFVLIKDVGSRIQNEKLIKGIDFLSSCTMASYVLHQYVLEYIIRPSVTDIFALKYNLFAPIFNFAICVLIASILKKIPLIKMLVP